MRVLITGASRGIGAAIARTFAQRHGASAQLALLGRSDDTPSHPSLEGTLQDTAEAVRRHGARAFTAPVDMQHGDALCTALKRCMEDLGGLDVLVNNASVLWIDKVASPRQMDLVHAVNTRGTMLCLQTCAEALADSERGGSVVTLSPPVRLGRLDWVTPHVPYTLSKYSMTIATLGAASDRVRANCLWPKRTVATAATQRLEPWMPGAFSKGRSPDLVAEAVHRLATELTCNACTLLDEEVLPDMPGQEAPLDAFVESSPSFPTGA